MASDSPSQGSQDLSEKESPPQGLLTKTTPEDQGLVKRPALTPHLRFHDIGEQQCLLVSESFNTLLRGKLYGDLIPLLNGKNTLDFIVSSLESKHNFTSVLSAIVALANKGYIVSADHSMESSAAAYWSTIGATPRWVEQRLSTAHISVTGDDGSLHECLSDSGVKIEANNPRLAVIVCDDYLDQELERTNQHYRQRNIPWLLVRPRGVEILFGPVFKAQQNDPCLVCLTNRLRLHQEVHNLIRHKCGDELAFKPFASNTTARRVVAAIVVNEIVRWFVMEQSAPLHKHAITLNSNTLSLTTHRVQARPQCPVCGDPLLYAPDRNPVPLTLNPCPKRVHNSGGIHSVAPEETIEKYQHLVSPISGVTTWLRRRTNAKDPFLHVHWAGSNFGARARTLGSLRRSLRSKSAGKGSSSVQSRVSALCESIERFSGSLDGSEIYVQKSFQEFISKDGVIHPNEVQLFSEYQLNNAEELNAQGHPYNVIPRPFDESLVCNWTPVWSLTHQRHRYLPTSMLYSMPSELRSENDRISDSNGCAAGNTLEEAIIQGFYELVERDAFGIWWYNRLQKPAVDLTSFDDEYLNSATTYYEQLGRDFWVLDVTSDLDIPSFVAISRLRDSDSEYIVYGAGTHAEPRIAVLRAVCEHNQCLSCLPDSSASSGEPKIDDPFALHWWQNFRLKDCPWLKPTGPSRSASDFQVVDTNDLRDDIEYFRSMIEDKGLEFLVLDQTRPDIGMPVVKVIVPGLRHFWARFAPGRLFNVPVNAGLLQERLHESELNQTPVIV